MCNNKNHFENSITHRGLYRVWLQTYENGTPRLVSVWIDPAMRAFQPQATPETALNECLALSSDDEPPSWMTVDEGRPFVFAH
jgi:hypothetical protein